MKLNGYSHHRTQYTLQPLPLGKPPQPPKSKQFARIMRGFEEDPFLVTLPVRICNG